MSNSFDLQQDFLLEQRKKGTQARVDQIDAILRSPLTELASVDHFSLLGGEICSSVCIDQLPTFSSFVVESCAEPAVALTSFENALPYSSEVPSLVASYETKFDAVPIDGPASVASFSSLVGDYFKEIIELAKSMQLPRRLKRAFRRVASFVWHLLRKRHALIKRLSRKPSDQTWSLCSCRSATSRKVIPQRSFCPPPSQV